LSTPQDPSGEELDTAVPDRLKDLAAGGQFAVMHMTALGSSQHRPIAADVPLLVHELPGQGGQGSVWQVGLTPAGAAAAVAVAAGGMSPQAPQPSHLDLQEVGVYALKVLSSPFKSKGSSTQQQQQTHPSHPPQQATEHLDPDSLAAEFRACNSLDPAYALKGLAYGTLKLDLGPPEAPTLPAPEAATPAGAAAGAAAATTSAGAAAATTSAGAAAAAAAASHGQQQQQQQQQPATANSSSSSSGSLNRVVEVECALYERAPITSLSTMLLGCRFFNPGGRGTLPKFACRHLMLQLVRCLSHTHSRNLIHRDIKPGEFSLGAVGKFFGGGGVESGCSERS